MSSDDLDSEARSSREKQPQLLEGNQEERTDLCEAESGDLLFIAFSDSGADKNCTLTLP